MVRMLEQAYKKQQRAERELHEGLNNPNVDDCVVGRLKWGLDMAVDNLVDAVGKYLEFEKRWED